MAEEELERLRNIAAIAGFVPIATADTPWPSTRHRAVASLARHLKIINARVHDAGADIDPHGYLSSAHANLSDCIAAALDWSAAVSNAADSLCDADDLLQDGVPLDAVNDALERLDRSAAALRGTGKIYLNAWRDFRAAPLPHVVAPLTNIAMYSWRWYQAIARRENAQPPLDSMVSSASHYHWGLQNLAGTVEDETFPPLTAWLREIGGFINVMLAVGVEVNISAATQVRYHH